ncbi:hypothetical protein ABZ479_20650 [Streptomyces sp. NPDC005722]
MGDELRSIDDMLADPAGLSDDEIRRLKNERVHGATAVLLLQRGHADASTLLTEVPGFELDYVSTDWGKDYYEVVVDVEPHLLDLFTSEIVERIYFAACTVTEKDGFEINQVRIRTLLPKVAADWRDQLRASQGVYQTNQARRVRTEPKHPTEDGLHFTNKWEHRVYSMLKAHQATLPDNDTIGIMPLGAMRVLGHTFEPDLLVTYRGRVGVIEVDGPHHKARASDDKSRERLLRNAGVGYIDRIDVRDTTTKEQVGKFVNDFLRHLAG